MSRSKAKSNYKISLQEVILNLSNINYKSKNIAQCLSMVFAKKIEQKYVVTVRLFTKCHGMVRKIHVHTPRTKLSLYFFE